jgi:hypothetical protein
MRRARVWWLPALVSVAFAALPGCMLFDGPVGACPEAPPNAFDLPACSRNRVYFFLFGDLNPCHGMSSLREQLIEAGYIKVYCGKVWDLSWFSDELKKIHKEDAEARFVIISQGGASGAARKLAGIAGAEQVVIDLFVYLDAVPDLAPVAARQILSIHADGDDAHGAGAGLQFVLTDAGLEGAAGHPQTLLLVLQALVSVTGSVEVVDDEPKADLPTRPVATKHDDWDFLQPDGQDTPRRDGPVSTIAPLAPPALRQSDQP